MRSREGPSSMVWSEVRVSCDSVVAMGPRTATGRPIFAKNSDRPAAECQPLLQVAAADHPEGERLACQYIEIEQAEHTYAFVGASPSWLWGLEHGVNEHAVAIGNHSIFTRDEIGSVGLLGMDLVRLGLERGATADEALDAITSLIELHGQGGSGHLEMDFPYHNSFLIADPTVAWLLEASGTRWVARRSGEGSSVSNHTTIGTDWDRISGDCIGHAREMGWWDRPETTRFDFAAAYRDTSVIPPEISSGRYATTCRALESAGGSLDLGVMQRVMRDHYDSGEVHVPGREPDDEKYFSVCAHFDPVGQTNASMVVELDADPSRPIVYWAALTNPCVGPYLPLFLDGDVPAELMSGGAESSSGGAWWRFKELLTEVERDFETRAPLVRRYWSDFESGLAGEVDAVVSSLDGPPGCDENRRTLTSFMDGLWQRCSAALTELLVRVRAS